MKILAALAALSLSFSASALVPCASVQWTQIDDSPASGNVLSIETVDYDEDGELDLVGILQDSPGDALVWWKGAGDGTFGNATQIATAAYMSNVVVAELTGDAYLDVAVVTSTSFNLEIYPGTGSGRGSMVTSYFGNIPNTMTPVNMDADSVSELVASYGPGLFSVHNRVGSSFTTTHFEQTPDGLYASGIVSADFDLDGRFDVAIALRELSDTANDHVGVYFGNANGTYSAPVVLSIPGAYGLATADLDADGKMDLVATSWINELTWDPSTITVFRNTGSRTFSPSTLVVSRPGEAGNAPIAIEIAEVTGDAHLDILAGVTNGSWITTFAGLGGATYRQPTFTVTEHFGAMATGDFTGDGVLEIGAGTFSEIASLSRSCATQVSLYTESVMITAGTDAILHVHVSGFRSGMSGPFGSVTLYEGATDLATGVLGSSGVIAFTLSGQTLSVGEHTLHAVFSGNDELAGATSATIVQRVTSSVSSVSIGTPNAPVHGKSFTVALSVTGAGPYDDFVDVKIDGGTSFKKYTSTPLTLTLATGQHTIEARYPGSNWYPRSPWASLTFDVAKDTPSIGLGGALVVRQGTAHELTVSVTTAGTLGAPTGNVQLFEGASLLATSPLAGGTASFTQSFARGSHAIRAVYVGDANFNGVSLDSRLDVLPNVAFALDARSLANGIQIHALTMQDTNNASLQLQRRVAGTQSWQNVAGFSGTTSGVDTTVARGVAYDYQMTGTLTGGTPIVSNTDSALFFTDDALTAGALVKRTHFTELATAVNLLRAQAGLSAFAYESSFTAPGVILASHLTSLRAALNEARGILGMSTPTLDAVTAGSVIRLVDMNDTRDLAR